MAEFTASVYQNEFLPDGGTDVNAIVTVTCAGAGTAGQTGGGAAGEIIIVDTSGSMGPETMQAARSAAQAALAEIVDGTWFAVISGSDHAELAYPKVSSGPGMVRMSSAAREDASAALLNYGYTFFETVKLQKAGAIIVTPQVYKGAAESVAVGARGPVSVTIARGQGDSIKTSWEVKGPLVAPLAAGTAVGQYTVRVGDEVVARVPRVTLAKVEEGGLWRTTVDTVKLWFE